MTHEKAIRIARKRYGLPKFERECRLTREGRYLKKAYKVPGAAEAGQYHMLCMCANYFAKKLMES